MGRIHNIASGFFGGMGECAMIGQTMTNVCEFGARTRLSTLLASVFLLILMLVLGEVVGMSPMAALVGIMAVVSLGTIDWHSVHPRTLNESAWIARRAKRMILHLPWS